MAGEALAECCPGALLNEEGFIGTVRGGHDIAIELGRGKLGAAEEPVGASDLDGGFMVGLLCLCFRHELDRYWRSLLYHS